MPVLHLMVIFKRRTQFNKFEKIMLSIIKKLDIINENQTLFSCHLILFTFQWGILFLYHKYEMM